MKPYMIKSYLTDPPPEIRFLDIESIMLAVKKYKSTTDFLYRHFCYNCPNLIVAESDYYCKKYDCNYNITRDIEDLETCPRQEIRRQIGREEITIEIKKERQATYIKKERQNPGPNETHP